MLEPISTSNKFNRVKKFSVCIHARARTRARNAPSQENHRKAGEMAAINHEDESEKCLKRAAEHGHGSIKSALLAEATVHALLAIVSEVRSVAMR